MHGDYLLPALSRISSEDQQFALAFILCSGSLKQMAKLYGVSYPTVRNRLDDLIACLNRIAETQEKEVADDATAVGAHRGERDNDASGGEQRRGRPPRDDRRPMVV